jgi:NADP-dependent 3-hydroxy acid dehydrogenase YdfG
MVQTILITGASSGIGKATAKLFHNNGWNVIATMRSPEREDELTVLDNVLVTRLDVTDEASIAEAVAAGVDRFGQIDVLLNNAGYGAYGPLEAFPMENVRRQFDTNVIGLIATTKAVLPHMRGNGTGIIVNVSSIGGQMTFPLGALYHGTKFAVEGISEAMSYELKAAGIKMKIIEPGGVKTDFGGRSFDFTNDESMAEYQPVVQALFKAFEGAMTASEPEVVAECIWTAVTDGSDQLRYHATPDAVQLLTARKEQDDATFIGSMTARMGLDKL